MKIQKIECTKCGMKTMEKSKIAKNEYVCSYCGECETMKDLIKESRIKK